jgi:hypothetical protein
MPRINQSQHPQRLSACRRRYRCLRRWDANPRKHGAARTKAGAWVIESTRNRTALGGPRAAEIAFKQMSPSARSLRGCRSRDDVHDHATLGDDGPNDDEDGPNAAGLGSCQSRCQRQPQRLHQSQLPEGRGLTDCRWRHQRRLHPDRQPWCRFALPDRCGRKPGMQRK